VADNERETIVGTRLDGVLVNALTKMGTPSDKSTHTWVGPAALLSEVEIDNLYIGSWLCRRVVDLLASEATRAGWDIGLGSDSSAARRNSDKLIAYGQRLRLQQHMHEGLRLARLYGGAAVLVLVDDGSKTIEDLAEPVRTARLRRIRGLHPIDRYRIWPASGWNGVGEPEAYEFNTEGRAELARLGIEGRRTVRIHSSRVLRIEGEPAPQRWRPTLSWWGLSVLQSLWEVFRRYETAQHSAASILDDFDLFIHKIPELRRMLAAGKEDELMRRFEVNNLARSNYRALLLGADEEATFINRTAAGISDVMQQLKSEVTGASGLPHTKLWGESPSGLGATGRSEDQSLAADVAVYQDNVLEPPLRQFYELAVKAKDAPFKGELPEEWEVKFRHTFLRTEEETADLYGKVANADSQWINSGVLQAHEVAVARFGRPEFSLDTSLIDREKDGRVKQEDMDPSDLSFGGDLAGGPEEEAQGQPQPQPQGQPQGQPRVDAGEEPCCEACGRGDDCEDDCPGGACDAEPQDDDDREDESVGEVMHRWKHGTLHSGTGKKGEHRGEVPHGPEHHRQAVAIALSIAGKDRPARTGRRRNDAAHHQGRRIVAGCTVDVRADGLAEVIGPYNRSTGYPAVIGADSKGAWQVSTAAGDWFLVLGHQDAATLQDAVGADARLRRLDSLDLAAMGIRCDAYDG
jgi:phage-related protein (TIGR01555 family)